jgi:hypothetical protein
MIADSTLATSTYIDSLALRRADYNGFNVAIVTMAELAGQLQNYGVVLGSVTGSREGDFTLVSGHLPGSAVARVRVYGRPSRP